MAIAHNDPSRRLRLAERVLALALLLAGLLIAGTIVQDYGVGSDELSGLRLGRASLKVYGGGRVDWAVLGDVHYYGPLHFMAQVLGADLLPGLHAGWSARDAHHLVNFASFLVGAVALHAIVRRFTPRGVAWTVTALYVTQPLFFGHAFVNGKDIPFMSLFLVAFAVGLRALSRLDPASPALGAPHEQAAELDQKLRALARQDWHTASPRSRLALVLAAGAALALALELLILLRMIWPLLETTVQQAYDQTAWEPINRLFVIAAERRHRFPAETYVEKARRAYDLARHGLLALGSLPLAIAAAKVFRTTLPHLWRAELKPGLRRWRLPALLACFGPAGIVLGLAGSVRIFGLFAGLLVLLLCARRWRAGVIVPSIIYTTFAAATLYATWPYLWRAPIARVWESLQFMLHHPWRGYVFYQGHLVKGDELPSYFLPQLMSLQFTEPLVLLALVGFVHVVRSGRDRFWWFVVALWSLTPMLSAILGDPWLYDNFRQFFFVTPPLFLLAATGASLATRALRRPVLQLLLAAVCLAPGLVAIVQLHPYQHVYYNAIAGGVRGAASRFELDYWCTSLPEAARLATALLPAGGTVGVLGRYPQTEPYVGSGITLVTCDRTRPLADCAVDLAIVCSRAGYTMSIFPESEIVAQVGPPGAPLSVIRRGPLYQPRSD